MLWGRRGDTVGNTGANPKLSVAVWLQVREKQEGNRRAIHQFAFGHDASGNCGSLGGD